MIACLLQLALAGINIAVGVWAEGKGAAISAFNFVVAGYCIGSCIALLVAKDR